MAGRAHPRLARLIAPADGGLGRKRRLALAALWFERLWPALWPATGFAGACVCLALLDVPAALPPPWRVGFALLALLGTVGLAVRGLRRLRRPDLQAADRRLERASGLRHRPLAALSDRPAAATPEAEALWREHLARLQRQVRGLRVGRPRPGLAALDRWALRGALLVALVAAIGVAGRDAPSRLLRAAWPHWPATAAAPGVAVQAWITPPAYTGLPPVVLKGEATEARVPAGSHLTVSVTGGAGLPELVADGAKPFIALDDASWQAEADLGTPESGKTDADALRRVYVRRGGTLAAWTVTLIPDQPPAASFAEPPGAAAEDGRASGQSRFAWQAADDYGVQSASVELRLRERPDAPPLVVAVPVTGNRKLARGLLAIDLTAHPWAGLPVRARLLARDAPGQLGQSAEADLVLPERSFRHPAARLLIAVRKQLSLTPDDRRPARTAIDGLADQPALFDDAAGILLNLRALSSLLARGREPDTVDEAQRRMWDLAIALDENETERTLRALDRAEQALNDALDQNRPDPAEQAEQDRRIQELRDAIQKHLDALAEQARRDDAAVPFDPNLPQMNRNELDRRLDALRKALDEGRKADAERQLAELEKLLDALKNAKPESAEARAERRAAQRQRGREQQSAVQDMVQREGTLLDHSESRASSLQPRPLPGLGKAPDAGARDRGGDAKSQAAMRRALGELMQRFGDLTGDVPAPLGEADGAMRDAAQALADGRDGAAADATRRAIEALQKGSGQMGQQIARQFGTGRQPGEEQEGEDGQDGDGQGLGATDNRDGTTAGPQPGGGDRAGRRRTARRDPLGRPLGEGNNGSTDNGLTRVPDEMESARTRDLQEELRRRGAERTRPQPELDYIDRLLRPF